MTKNPLKLIFKTIIPFKSLRKKIRKIIQNRNTSEVPKMKEADIKLLEQFYKDDVNKLSELLGKNLKTWVE